MSTPAGRAAVSNPFPWLGAAAGAYLAAFLVVPLAFMLWEAAAIVAGGGLGDLPDFSGYVLRLTGRSLLLAAVVTAITVVISLPLALWAVKAVPWQPLFFAALTVPLLAPPFIGSFAIVLLLGRTGVLTQLMAGLGWPTFEVYGLTGIAIAHVIHSIPLAFLTLAAGLRSVPRGVEEAAVSLGGHLPGVARRVVLPYIAPYIAMAALLVFLVSFGDVGAPLIVGGNYQVLPVAAYTSFVSFVSDPRVPVLLSAWMVAISLGLLAAVRRAMGRTEIAPTFGGGEVYRYRSRTARIAGTAYCSLVSFLVLLPYGAIAVASLGTVWSVDLLPDAFTLRHYTALGDSLRPLANSMLLAAVATPIAVGLALVIGQVIRDRPRAGAVFDYVTTLPFVVSGVVIGIGLVRLISQLSGAGLLSPVALALPFMSGPALLVVAFTVRRLPYPMRVLTAGYSRIDRRLEEAAYTLGASPGRTFRTVVLPQLYPAVLAGAVIAFIQIITELAATLVAARPGWETIALKIFSYAQDGRLHRAAAASVLLIAVVSLLTLGLHASGFGGWRSSTVRRGQSLSAHGGPAAGAGKQAP